jgi:hypothetical protein
MADENKDQQNQDQNQDSKETPKTVPYERFAEVNKKYREIESKLTEIVTKQTEEAKKRENEELAKKGAYDQLLAKVESERTQEKQKLNTIVRNTFLTTMGVKSGILKPEYVNLFKGEVQVDGLEIKNASTIEDEWNKFRQENPTLFNGEKKEIPKTDNQPFKKPDDSGIKVSAGDLILKGMQERKTK